jgi:SAM-dependent methyltransferase
VTVRNVGPREGYDRWAETYDATPNPVVWLDERETPQLLRGHPGELLLDAGCGTGRHLGRLRERGATVVGVDFSLGMLRVARRALPGVPLVLADLQRTWPFPTAAFDGALCALVGEHLDALLPFARELRRVVRPAGRVVFSVYHPAMAEAGKEANFRQGEVEYRLGAVRHTLADYCAGFTAAGFAITTLREVRGDAALAEANPAGRRYLGFPVLAIFVLSG